MSINTYTMTCPVTLDHTCLPALPLTSPDTVSPSTIIFKFLLFVLLSIHHRNNLAVVLHLMPQRFGMSNDLPDEVRGASSLAIFRSKLKTYLFTQAYPP